MDDFVEVGGVPKRRKKKHIRREDKEHERPDFDVERKRKLEKQGSDAEVKDFTETSDEGVQTVTEALGLDRTRAVKKPEIRSTEKKDNLVKRKSVSSVRSKSLKGLGSPHRSIPEPDRFKPAGGRGAGKSWTGKS